MLMAKCDVLIAAKWSMLVLQVSKILTNDTEAGKPEKANTNVNNGMCEACDAEKTR